MGYDNWPLTRLGDLISIKHGWPFKSQYMAQYQPGKPIVVAIGNFEYSGGFRFERTTIKAYTGDYPTEFILKPGDILLVMTCQTAGGEILGIPGRIPHDNRTYLHNQRMGKVIVKDRTNVDIGFLYWLFLTSGFNRHLAATATGTKILHTAPERIESFKFLLPPLPTQHTIASILSAYDDLIENNTRRIAVLEEMAQMLYQEWFVKFRFPGHGEVKMVESELRLVPEGWEVTTIGAAVEVLGGGTPSTKIPEYWNDGDINWFSPTDLTSSGTIFMSKSAKKITALGLKESSARLFPAYSVMMTSRATIGVIAINTKQACTNQGFIICIPNEQLSAYQIYHWLMINRQKINSLASGATFKEINRATFKQLQIIIPPQDIRKLFNEFVHPIYKQVENLTQKNSNLRRTRDMLLPKLIAGEIDVSGWGRTGAEADALKLVATMGAGMRVEPVEQDGLEWRSLWES